MGTINKGGQVHLFDYRQEITSQGFNQHTNKLFARGIYSGGELFKISDTQVSLSSFLSVFEDIDAKVTLKIETTEAVIIESPSIAVTPYIIGRFTWQNAEENYMDFFAVAEINLLPTDLIFGKIVFNGSTIIDFDYSQKSWSYNYYHDILSYEPPFRVIPNDPYDNKVLVLPGGPYTIQGRQVTISTPTESPAFTFPISSNGRTDVVYVDSQDSSVGIIQGEDISGVPTPQTANSQFPIAIIRFPPSSTAVVKGSYIEYLHPDNFRSNPVQLDYPTETDSVPDSYALRDSDGDLTAKQFHSDIADGTTPLTVLSSTMVDNLNVEMIEGFLLKTTKEQSDYFAKQNSILIPLYIYPTGGSIQADYASVIALARKYPEVSIYAIVNPSSGPGTVVDGNYTDAIKALRGANVKVLGYVSTDYPYTVGHGTITVEMAKQGIDTWLALYPDITGIFLDEMSYASPITEDIKNFYKTLTQYGHIHGLFPVVSNPGVAVPESYFTDELISDVIVIYENSGFPTEDSIKLFSYNYQTNNKKRAILVYGVGSYNETGFFMIKKYANMVFCNNGAVMPNPWNSLTSTLEDQLIVLSNNESMATKKQAIAYSLVFG